MCHCQSILVNDKYEIQSSSCFVVLDGFDHIRIIYCMDKRQQFYVVLLGSEILLPPDFGLAQISLSEVKSNRWAEIDSKGGVS